MLEVARLFVRSSNERANYWIGHANCVRGHVDDISRAAAAGRTLSSDAIGYATMPGVRSPDFTQDQLDKLAGVIGNKRTRALKQLEGIDAFVTNDLTVISNEWTKLRLLDPSLGTPSAEDRARVRLAAIVLRFPVRVPLRSRRIGQAGDCRDGDAPDRRRTDLSPGRSLRPECSEYRADVGCTVEMPAAAGRLLPQSLNCARSRFRGNDDGRGAAAADPPFGGSAQLRMPCPPVRAGCA